MSFSFTVTVADDASASRTILLAIGLLESSSPGAQDDLKLERGDEVALASVDALGKTQVIRQPLAIVRALARARKDKTLVGRSDDERAEIEEFVSLAGAAASNDADALQRLNERLRTRVFFVGHRLTLADLAVYTALASSTEPQVPSLFKFKDADRVHLLRWYRNVDYVCSLVQLPLVVADVKPVKTDKLPAPTIFSTLTINGGNSNNSSSSSGSSNNKSSSAGGKANAKKNDNGGKKKLTPEQLDAQRKAKKEAKAAAKAKRAKELAAKKAKAGGGGGGGAKAKFTDDIGRCDIRVGKIVKAAAHEKPTLCTVEVECGLPQPISVVTGLTAAARGDMVTADDGRCVVLVNVGGGRVFTVTSGAGERATLRPPAGAKIGERVTFAGINDEPEQPVVNKKKLNKVLKALGTSAAGVAQYKELAFTTSAGPVKSSLVDSKIN